MWSPSTWWHTWWQGVSCACLHVRAFTRTVRCVQHSALCSLPGTAVLSQAEMQVCVPLDWLMHCNRHSLQLHRHLLVYVHVMQFIKRYRSAQTHRQARPINKCLILFDAGFRTADCSHQVGKLTHSMPAYATSSAELTFLKHFLLTSTAV
jgi:hypothetical protein